MSDYISREDTTNALDALCDRTCPYSKKQRASMCGACTLGGAFDVVEEMPAADVLEAGEKNGKFYAFARLVAKFVVDEDFEKHAGAYAEILCRHLRHIGIVTSDDENWIFNPTHGDDIRAMTDEELAGWIARIDSWHRMPYARKDKREWLDWLKQEAEI